MGSEWEERRLDELTELIVDCPHSTPKWTDEGVSVLRSNNIKNGRLDLSSPSFTTEEGYQDRIKRAVPSADDVVLTREAPMGEVCKIPNDFRCCLGQRMVLLRTKKEIMDSSYLLFALQSPYLKHQISWNEGTGTTVSNIRMPNIRAFKIPTPPLQEQKAIAHILGSLDDKIELNQQINKTLEAMAQALFKSWFVDFDPVIDNALAAGNPIPEPLQARAAIRQQQAADKQQQDIRKQFPSEFEFSEEMGWIPKGWRIKPLDKVANYQNGLALQKFRPTNEYDFLPVVKIAQLKSGVASTDEKASINIKPECVINNGDVIFSWSGSLVVDIWCGGKAALNQHLFKVTSQEYSKWLYLYYTKYHLNEFQRIARDKAVTMGHIKREHLKQALCIIPDNQLLQDIDGFIRNLVDQQVENKLETQTLTSLRNTLLPKLLSGEIRIPDAEKLIQKAIK